MRSKNKKRRKQRRRKDSFFYPIGKLPSVSIHPFCITVSSCTEAPLASKVSKHGFFRTCFRRGVFRGPSRFRPPDFCFEIADLGLEAQHRKHFATCFLSFFYSFYSFHLILLSTKFTSLYFTSFITSLLLVFSKPGDVARPGTDAAAAAGTALPAALAGEAAPLVMRSGSRMRLRKTQLHSEKPNRDE